MEEAYVKGAILFSVLTFGVLTFAGLYFDVAITLIALPFLVFLVVLFMGWSNNRSLDKGEMRRAIAAIFVAAFMVLVIGNKYLNVPPELRDYLLGVLSTVIGFYFGYRGRESEEERLNMLAQRIQVEGEGKSDSTREKGVKG
ncbi:hypothetical protein APY94_09380 [Thermococcus celericrescens]|uniref:Uncharacterized protein n=1 Tax=Thermococcus celericrescens TaxID=227598 RepID=A0A117IT82_9EURY|nr:hypothetical protein [Thermococcus celericrescens]KUH32575.1 hypothetical protein APY94_09380 [Thermococcus celericrescens]